MIKDKDLISIQEVRNLVQKAKEAQSRFSTFDQYKIDKIVQAVSKAASKEAENLAKFAKRETGFGKWEDKVEKNKLASDKLYEYIKDMKTIGVLNEDKERKIVEIGTPVGVIAGLIPSTNPTSTAIYKALISLKSGNAIVFSPHPSAIGCISKTVEILNRAAVANGAPDGLISCMEHPTIEGTNELMKHKDVALILATGGSAMVKAAYSSGTPALGVGPGNVPAYIERSADIKLAVKRIFASKTFDNGTICASEQSIVTEKIIEDKVKDEIERQGGYFLEGEKLEKIVEIMERPNGGMNPKIVGKSAQEIADMVGIDIPEGTRVLLCEEKGIGKEYPFSKEKLTALLGFYVVEDWEEACELCFKLLENGGLGHSLSIHSKDENIIREFGLKKPVSRILVNTPSSQGAVGITTNLAPSLTLGCGAIGGSATSDNITPMNLINIRRMAYGVEDVDMESCVECESEDLRNIDIEAITKLVMEQIQKINE
ncbi:acetaldehyde dehydrogenase (acetylating) [Anaerosalibacter bizertensis]|uniref:Acetaldehyde dehydrogenase (Acetylating) n=1 Tax=Anaerosalibacter bizertensis TaxID=932217 RepID=A0A844FJM3_9FIRM|nr:acetaldehyde dehydrogenase (acetylating) [Anaerosalibacter bizertensis]MSS44333.1 acetaldehyde dehydrogenase (acetylating) [Anaerosalibacter bizertensis]